MQIIRAWSLFHLFEEDPELLQGNLTIPISVEFRHQLGQLLLAHAPTQLAELARIDRAWVILVNCLNIIAFEYIFVFLYYYFYLKFGAYGLQ